MYQFHSSHNRLIIKEKRFEETLLFSVESAQGDELIVPRSFRTVRSYEPEPSRTFPLIITTFHNKAPSELDGSYLVGKSDHFYGKVQIKRFGKVWLHISLRKLDLTHV